MQMGWIKIHREIMDHWIFQDSEKFKWWIDLLLLANHEKKKMVFGNRLFVCDRGQLVWSLKTLSERWNVSRSKVRGFIQLLKDDTMISTENLTHTTRTTICNYDYWQGEQHTKRTPKTTKSHGKQPSLEQASNINKNIEELKEDYRKEIKLSKDDKEYTSFVWFLFEKNDTGKPLDKVLHFDDPITWEKYQILKRKIEILKSRGKSVDSIKHKIMSLEDSTKKYSKCFRTINNWFVREAKLYGIDLPDNDEIRDGLKNEEENRRYGK